MAAGTLNIGQFTDFFCRLDPGMPIDSTLLYALQIIVLVSFFLFLSNRRKSMSKCDSLLHFLLLVDAGQLRRRYQLSVKLFHEHANWDNVHSITDLVVPVPSPYWFQKVVDGALSYTIDR
jgi:hypothetical protein